MPRKKTTRKDLVLDRCYDELETEDPASPRFDAITSQVNKLETKPTPVGRLSKDTLLTVGAYIGLTMLIIVIELFGESINTSALTKSPFRPRIK